jgi:hypothetical protein
VCRYDESNHKRYAPGLDMKSPALLVTAAGRFFYATAARLLALKFILSMSVSQHLSPLLHVSRITPHTCSLVQSAGAAASHVMWHSSDACSGAADNKPHAYRVQHSLELQLSSAVARCRPSPGAGVHHQQQATRASAVSHLRPACTHPCNRHDGLE